MTSESISFLSGGTHNLMTNVNSRLVFSVQIIKIFYIFSYIIGRYNRLVKFTIQIHTPLKLCVVILYISVGTYSLKSTLNDILLHCNFIYSRISYKKFAEEICYHILFCWFKPWPDFQHSLLDYSDFTHFFHSFFNTAEMKFELGDLVQSANTPRTRRFRPVLLLNYYS